MPPLTSLLACCAAALGALAWSLAWPWPSHDPVLALLAARSPLGSELLRAGYAAAWILTPYFAVRLSATVASLLVERRARPASLAKLPPWPERSQPQIVVGEAHLRTRPGPSLKPAWLTVQRRGLYAGTAVLGAVGSGKTSCCMYPFTRQLLGWHPDQPALRPAALVLEVKGDFCHQVRQMLAELDRPADYVELSLHGKWCYNPLASDLDAYSQAFQIASLLSQLFGKGKEPFWQQAYTNLVKFLICLYRLCDGYVTLQQIYRAALDSNLLQRQIDEARRQFDYYSQVRLSVAEYEKHRKQLQDHNHELDYDRTCGEWFATATRQLIDRLDKLEADYRRQDPPPADDPQRELLSIITWHKHDWSQLDPRLRSSITEGISVFLSLFDQPSVAEIFCPPKQAYTRGSTYKGRKALPPLSDALEAGKVLALNLPVGANPALGRAIGVMLKQDFQRSVLERIPRMAARPDKPWRDIAFICDEYQHFATVGENDPGGDEKFFSLSRQARLVALVATQSISSLRSALPGESWRTLLQTFRTRIFLTLSDEFSCKQASEACGHAERLKEQYSISESSQSGVGLLSGRAGGGKGTFGVTKSYSLRREAVFQPSAFAELRNAQAIVAAYDGRDPLPASYCYLRPGYLPAGTSHFQALAEGQL